MSVKNIFIIYVVPILLIGFTILSVRKYRRDKKFADWMKSPRDFLLLYVPFLAACCCGVATTVIDEYAFASADGRNVFVWLSVFFFLAFFASASFVFGSAVARKAVQGDRAAQFNWAAVMGPIAIVLMLVCIFFIP